MDRRSVLAAALLTACGADLGNGPTDAAKATDSSTVTPADSATTPDGMTPLGAWGTPTLIPGGNSGDNEDDSTLSSTKLELFFKRSDSGDNNLYVMTRQTPTGTFGTPTSLGAAFNTTATEESPRLSPDDLTLYFGRAGDIYAATRGAVGGAWSTPAPVPTLNTTALEKWAAVCSNGYVIVSRSVTNNGQDLFEGNIATGANTALGQMNTTANEQGTFLTADCLGLYFQSNRTNQQFDIYMASRTSTNAAWSNPTTLADFNTAADDEEDPWLSTDQKLFVFSSTRNGNKDLYMSTR